MITITATEMARKLRHILDQVEFRHESVTVMRNKRPVARIFPGTQEMTALEALGDLYGIVGEEAAAHWGDDARNDETVGDGVRDPWDT
ncbi:type II toxin-antitoxin system Phd/YefM family antitoxin [Endothiovibrio diazotrophicus]